MGGRHGDVAVAGDSAFEATSYEACHSSGLGRGDFEGGGRSVGVSQRLVANCSISRARNNWEGRESPGEVV